MQGGLRFQSKIGLFLVGIFLLCSSVLISSYANAKEDSRRQVLKKHLAQVISKPNWSVDQRLSAILRVAATDHEKAWLVYQWVTQYFRHDTALASKIGNPRNHSLDSLYQKGGGSCAVYADVVQRLLEQAGLEVKTIYGTVKSGGRFSARSGLPVNHVWNAVKIDGQWRVIDATWGAGYLGNHGFQREQSDLFFLMPPEVAVLSHFDQSDELGSQEQFGITEGLFRKMPEEAIYAASIGFDSAEILSFQRRNLGSPLVKTFDQPLNVFKVLDAPIQGRLSKRATHTFKLESTQYQDLMVVQGKSWVPMKKNGSVHSLTLQPQSGELLVMGRRSKQDDFEAMLAYTVN